ncbi:MAG: radical SAM protein [Odoribacter sp.]|nr:radical SAM protein [Odoribacter sp.]
MYKLSKYSFLIPIEEKNISLIYNTLYGGLYEAQEQETEYLKTIFEEKTVDESSVPKHLAHIIDNLVESNYLVKEDVDEYEIYKRNYLAHRGRNMKNGRFGITVTPTLACNLACRYCFQNGSEAKMMKEETWDGIVKFLEDRTIEQGGVNAKTKVVHLTWFGGEPLLAVKNFENFTQKLLALCEKYGFEYTADIVTNGTLLTDENWEIIKKCHIKNIQVTLDGPAETHDLRRLCKSGSGENYEKILRNLEKLPDNIHLAIRINCDKVVWSKIHKLLDDLEKHGIWPQKARQMNISLAFITSHENARFDDCDWHFNINEFFDVENKFIDVKIEHYNKWAAENDKKPARKSFKMPQTTYDECNSAVNPNGFVIDPEGYIHKCWEDVDKPSTRISHVLEPYIEDKESYTKWLSYSKVDNPECIECQFLPVCNIHCTKKMIEDKRNKSCVNWKVNLSKEFKRQYIEKLENPALYTEEF